jgi:hypothetical protein
MSVGNDSVSKSSCERVHDFPQIELGARHEKMVIMWGQARCAEFVVRGAARLS